MQIDIIYDNFLVIFIVLTIITVLAILFIVRLRYIGIGDKVLEFGESTIVVKKAKRKPDKLLEFDNKKVSRLYTPRLLKGGFTTSRIFLIEEGASQTTDLFGVIDKSKDKRRSEANAKNLIVESSVIDKMLAVFSKIGFSIENFLFGCVTGALVIFVLLQTGVL